MTTSPSPSPYQIIKQLEHTSSSNEKIEILRAHQSNGLFCTVVRYALDPYKTFYIKKLPEHDRTLLTAQSTRYTLDDCFNLLDLLANRTYTGIRAERQIADLLSGLSDEDADVASRILTKDLKCGVNAKTVNKAWQDMFIPIHPCMLASKMDQKTLANIEYPAFGQLKADGMRINAIVDTLDNTVQFLSRKGRPVDAAHSDLIEELLAIGHAACIVDDVVVIDGEMIAVHPTTGEPLDRKTSNGICNKAIQNTIGTKDRSCLKIIAWDLILFQRFNEHYDKTPYGARLYQLQIAMDAADIESFRHVDVVRTTMVHNEKEAMSLSKRYIDDGHEGIVLKNKDSPWENKRSKHWVKFKQVLSADVRCYDVTMGTGKFDGMIGSLECISADGVRFSVGSGLTDDERDPNIIGGIDTYIDRIVEIEYNGLITRKDTDVVSVFLPIFVRTRNDKHEPDALLCHH